MATINGTVGNDTFLSLVTSDTLRGGLGNDTYQFSGNFAFDTVSEYVDSTISYGGTDTIHLTSALSSSVRVYTSGSDDLVIAVVDSNNSVVSSVTINNQFSDAYPLYKIENLKFADGTEISLTGGLTLQGAVNVTSLSGTKFGDTLISNVGNETLRGATGDDTYLFSGSFGFDAINEYVNSTISYGGSDTVHLASANAGSVRMYTDGSSDLTIAVVDINGSATSSVTISNQFWADFPSYVVETLKFADGSTQSLTGGLTVQGINGQSTLYATKLDDTLVASAWNETMRGGSGNDTYVLSGNFGFDAINEYVNTTFGYGGNDVIQLASASAGSVRMSKTGSDNLTITVVDANGAAVSNVTISNQFSTDKSYAIETLRLADGSTINLTGALTVQGVRDQAELVATGFDDTLIAGSWNETLYGGAGNDTYVFSAGFGNDTIREASGGGGTDTIVLDGSVNLADLRIVREAAGSNNLVIGTVDGAENFTSKVTILNHFVGGDAKVETLRLADGSTFSIDALLNAVGGSDGSDTINSTPGSTIIDGGAGNDSITDLWGNNTVNGGAGNDRIVAGNGEDILNGGSGKDRLTGGAGKDVMTGGSSADRFIFTSTSDSIVGFRDVITDFKRGSDRIDLRAIDADIDGTAGNQTFKFIGTKKFSGKDGELRFKNGVLSADVNGDKVADFQLEISKIKVMSSGDFIL